MEAWPGLEFLRPIQIPPPRRLRNVPPRSHLPLIQLIWWKKNNHKSNKTPKLARREGRSRTSSTPRDHIETQRACLRDNENGRKLLRPESLNLHTYKTGLNSEAVTTFHVTIFSGDKGKGEKYLSTFGDNVVL